jgi:hypothetical protein
VIPCAFLRVFRPLGTFPDEERSQWERYILSGGPPVGGRPVYRDEVKEGERRVGLLASAQGEYADVRLVDGQYYVCPWRTRFRILASKLSLRETAPAEMADVFVPEAEARRVARELARIRRREPFAVPCMLQSPWHVPVRWFILVGEEERHITREGEDGLRLYYWTPLAAAKKRSVRALQLLRRSELAPLAQLVRELAEWLSAFPPESRLELDYGSVASLFSWDELDDDHSGRDIQDAIDALGEQGGMARAAELYQQVANHWADVMGRDSLN